MSHIAAGTDGLASSKARFLTCAGRSSMSNVAIKFSHTGPSQGALPLADRGRRIFPPSSFLQTRSFPPTHGRPLPVKAVDPSPSSRNSRGTAKAKRRRAPRWSLQRRPGSSAAWGFFRGASLTVCVCVVGRFFFFKEGGLECEKRSLQEKAGGLKVS